jgi:hypothetical protein
MIFPDVAPSRADCQRQIVEALASPGLRLYVDSSVLIHCYEMSRSACEELLSALDLLGTSVRVPVWTAKETWERTRQLPHKRPLAKTAGTLIKRLQDLRSESLRYVDEGTFDNVGVDEFTKDFDEAVASVETLMKMVERIEPGHDDANALLLPFIANHALSSDMRDIYAEVAETGETRYVHEVPPGFADGGVRTVPVMGAEEEDQLQLKGKKRNRFGDLIMWLEALQDCAEDTATHLMILTRDNTKKDWVYNPERVKGDDGKLQQNGGLITLPLPLLVQEAVARCPSLDGVHVLSLEMFTQVARTALGARVDNLVRALQAQSSPVRAQRAGAARPERAAPTDGQLDVSFSSLDMIYEPPQEEQDDPIWANIEQLRAEGWTAQNEAAVALEDLALNATPDQLKQIGRGIIAASNEAALEPVNLANSLLNNPNASAEVRANLLVGMLAETYFNEDGEAVKPVAIPEITTALFAHAADADTKRAYEVTIDEPLAPIRRLYLALPGENERKISLEIQLNQSTLVGTQADGKELLEANAPESRRMAIAGRKGGAAVADLVGAIAREFVLPAALFEIVGPSNFEIEIPERMGFIAWGPTTGEHLR